MQGKELTVRQRYWLEHIQSWNKSGQRMSEYAREQNFPVRAMYDAKKTLVKKGLLPPSRSSYSSTRFDPVQIIESSNESQWRVALPNGTVVEFRALLDEQTLNTVLKIAARI
jgi:hypothetical protein